MYYRRGSISIRSLVALLITMNILPLAVSVLTYSSNLKFKYDEINDEISLLQLRRILLIAYDVQNNGSSLEFVYHNDDYYLSLNNNRLILQPGYQMFLDKVDDVSFIEKGNSIYIYYAKNNKEYKTPIIKQRGIYLADFLDDNDELSNASNDYEWVYY